MTSTPRPSSPHMRHSAGGSYDWRSDKDRAIEFARRWAPGGGGSAEDIFVQFGVSEPVFFTRLAYFLDTSPSGTVPPDTLAILRAMCEQRLRHSW